MSGGGGGVIIIQNVAHSDRVPPNLKQELLAIADRSPVKCSFADKVRVIRIVWQLLK